MTPSDQSAIYLSLSVMLRDATGRPIAQTVGRFEAGGAGGDTTALTLVTSAGKGVVGRDDKVTAEATVFRLIDRAEYERLGGAGWERVEL